MVRLAHLNFAVFFLVLALIFFIRNLWLRKSQVASVATKPLPHVVVSNIVYKTSQMDVQRIITFPPCCSKDVMYWLITILYKHPSLTLLNISCPLSWFFHPKGRGPSNMKVITTSTMTHMMSCGLPSKVL